MNAVLRSPIVPKPINPNHQTTMIEAYLFFNGDCQEAVDFYCKHLDAKLEMLMRFDESPEPTPPGMVPDGWERKVMHASLRIGESRVMLSDGCESGGEGFNGFSLSLTVADEAEATRVFGVLSDGGTVQMPIGKTFWSPCFGIVEDRFGVSWMITVPDTQGQ